MKAAVPASYAFAGTVRCECHAGKLRLAGIERTTGRPMVLALVGVAGDALPARMDDLVVRMNSGSAGSVGSSYLSLHWRDGDRKLVASAVHVAWGADASLAAAMPGVTASWRGRLGWALLLNLVRVPGVTRLLRAIRGGG
jgi:hypothetical protein